MLKALKEAVPILITYFNWKLMFDCDVVRWGSKNIYQNDMCS
jgi:hypothetical protein